MKYLKIGLVVLIMLLALAGCNNESSQINYFKVGEYGKKRILQLMSQGYTEEQINKYFSENMKEFFWDDAGKDAITRLKNYTVPDTSYTVEEFSEKHWENVFWRDLGYAKNYLSENPNWPAPKNLKSNGKLIEVSEDDNDNSDFMLFYIDDQHVDIYGVKILKSYAETNEEALHDYKSRANSLFRNSQLRGYDENNNLILFDLTESILH